MEKVRLQRKFSQKLTVTIPMRLAQIGRLIVAFELTLVLLVCLLNFSLHFHLSHVLVTDSGFSCWVPKYWWSDKWKLGSSYLHPSLLALSPFHRVELCSNDEGSNWHCLSFALFNVTYRQSPPHLWICGVCGLLRDCGGGSRDLPCRSQTAVTSDRGN